MIALMKNVNNNILESINLGDSVIFCDDKSKQINTKAKEGDELYLSKNLDDFGGTSFIFSGHNKIVCYASCTSPMWSVRVTNQKNQASFTLTGFATSTEIFKKIYIEDRDPILNWNFTATKGAGDNCIAKVSFWKDKACDCIICTCPPGMYYDPVTKSLKRIL